MLPEFLTEEEIGRFGKALESWRGDHLKARYLPEFRPFPMVRELVERILASGRKVGIATSAQAEEMEKYLEIAGIADLIAPDDAASKGDAERSKPHPDIFHAAMAKLDGIAPAEALAVGDTPYDALASSKAGLVPVGVLCGGFPAADLTSSGCVALFRDPADLLARFDDLMRAGSRSA